MTERQKINIGLLCLSGKAIECKYCAYSDDNGCGRGSICKNDVAEDALTFIYYMQSTKPGRWIRMTGFMPPEYYGHYECSECGWHGGGYQPVEDTFAFCPNCGARMTGVQMHD